MPNIFFIINEPNNFEMLSHYQKIFSDFKQIHTRLIIKKNNIADIADIDNIKIFKNFENATSDIDLKIGIVNFDLHIKRNIFSPKRIADLIFENHSFKSIALIFNGTAAMLKNCEVLSVAHAFNYANDSIPNYFDAVFYAYEFQKHQKFSAKKLPSKNTISSLQKNIAALLNKLSDNNNETVMKKINELLYFADAAILKNILDILSKIKS